MVTDRIIIINNGPMSMEITTKPYYVKEIKGIDGLESTIVTSQGFNQSGATIVNTITEPRIIEISGQINADSTQQMQYMRSKLISLFPHSRELTLYHYYGGSGRKISVMVEKGPTFEPDNVSTIESYSVRLKAGNPYWEDIEEVKYSVANWIPKLHFPLIVPVGEKIVFGVKNASYIVNVQNNSSMEIPMKIVFKANGALYGPQLFNIDTREFIKINCAMDYEDRLTVDTKKDKPKVTYESGGSTKSYIDKIDLVGGGHTFLKLKPGENLLRYSAEEGENSLVLEIYVNNKYEGV